MGAEVKGGCEHVWGQARGSSHVKVACPRQVAFWSCVSPCEERCGGGEGERLIDSGWQVFYVPCCYLCLYTYTPETHTNAG